MRLLDTESDTMRTDSAVFKEMVKLVCKGYAYCTRKCCMRGSPQCFSCMFRDIRKLHGELKSYGLDDDGTGGTRKADGVQLVRKEVDGTREDSQPRGQVNTPHLQEALRRTGEEAEGVGLVGGDGVPEVGRQGVPQ